MLTKYLSKLVSFLEKHERILWLISYGFGPLAFLMLVFKAKGSFASFYGAIAFIIFLASLTKSIKHYLTKK